jgi:hypothetical protein
MVDAVTNRVTIIDHVRDIFNWEGTDKVLTDAEIESYIFQNFTSSNRTGQVSEYTFDSRLPGKVYALAKTPGYGLWLYQPSFTGQTVTGTVTGTTSTTVLIDSSATFETDGITVGQLITLDVGGETATVTTVDSETQITSSALSGSGTYDNGEAYTLSNEYRLDSRGSIKVTEGTDSRDEILVTGATVDFPTVIVQIGQMLMTHAAKVLTISDGAGSISPATIRSELQQIINQWQGVQAIF